MGTLRSSSARPASAAMSRERRGSRSTQTPAGRPAISTGKPRCRMPNQSSGSSTNSQRKAGRANSISANSWFIGERPAGPAAAHTTHQSVDAVALPAGVAQSFEHQGNRASRQGKWKLVAFDDQPWELYDLSVDRTEMNDLSEKHAFRFTWDAEGPLAHLMNDGEPLPDGFELQLSLLDYVR